MYTGLYCVSSDQETVSALITSLCRGIDHKINLMTKDQIHDVRGFLCDLIDTQRIYPMLLQIFCGTSGRVDLVAERFKALCNTNGLRLCLLYTSPSPRDTR